MVHKDNKCNVVGFFFGKQKAFLVMLVTPVSHTLGLVLVVHVFLVNHSQRGEQVSHEEHHVRAAAHQNLHIKTQRHEGLDSKKQ